MGWACRACTFVNEDDKKSSCEVCQKRREGNGLALCQDDSKAKRPKTGGTSKQMTLFGQVAVDPKYKKKASRKTVSQQAAPTVAKDKAVNVSQCAQVEQSYATLSKRAQTVLKTVFGFEQLRGLQAQALECALHRQSQIIVMATGGGKSLCYQLPAVTMGGTTLVISPLKALIADQVQGLVEKGIAAAFLSSQLSEAAKTDVMERVLQRSLRSRSKPADYASWKGKSVNLLYCTPETVETNKFRASLLELHKSGRLSGFAVDEAHCVSSWGHTFRPSYLKLDYLRQTFPELPLMACTATATSQVLDDIRKFLRLQGRPCHLGSFDRPNIFYTVRYRDLLEEHSPRGATGDMVDFIKKQHRRAQKNGTKINGIVYVHKQKDTTELAQIISEQTGIHAEGYHGGMKDVDRIRIQEAWSSGETPVAIATVAFGMGIDCPHVRYVIHWNLAKTVEGFYQESGRAGRDGLPAYSLLYFSKRDVSTFEYLARMEKSKKKDANVHTLQALEKMVDYCTKPCCRRQYLLKFFGEADTDPKTVCQRSCDFCRNPEKVTRIIEAASCVNDFSFHTGEADKKEWDGQWAAPHGDDSEGDDDNMYKAAYSKSTGLSLLGEAVDGFAAPMPSQSSGKHGFTKASDMLAKYEAQEKREAAESAGDRKRKQSSTHIVPEHLILAAQQSMVTGEQKAAPKSSSTLNSEAARLRAELDKLKSAKDAIAKKSTLNSLKKRPPPPPPLVVFSKRRR